MLTHRDFFCFGVKERPAAPMCSSRLPREPNLAAQLAAHLPRSAQAYLHSWPDGWLHSWLDSSLHRSALLIAEVGVTYGFFSTPN